MNALPPPLSEFVSAQLVRLCQSPTVLSQPVTILQPHGQLFEMRYESGGAVVWVSIVFRFGQDEQTIHIEHIASEFG